MGSLIYSVFDKNFTVQHTVIFSDKVQKMRKSIEKFLAFSDHASEMAALNGDPMGLILMPPDWRDNPLDEGWQYHWQRLTFQGWVDVEGMPAIEFPNSVELQIFIEEEEWEYKEPPEIIEPIIVFYSSGDLTIFEIEFRHDDFPEEIQTILVDEWGEVRWKEREEMLEELGDIEEYQEQFR